ncbi:MAG TPA: OB-fold domain-containing protein [Streptosporangiaceae bacterium]|nr:OB-fold domain-containing protein [Streptosporangiaceae bacterium]
MLTAQVGQDAAEQIRAAAERIKAAGESSPRLARDSVNLPIIENWVEAIGDANPVYTDPEFAAASVHGGLVAPPAMAQVWTMPGQRRVRDASDPLGQIVTVLDDAGYTSVVATNSDQVYHRYLRPGERLSIRVALIDLIGPKRTALGEGWFFTTRSTWYSGDEVVATMDFRILKFRPPAKAAAAGGPAAQGARPAVGAGPAGAGPAAGGFVPRPVVSPDTAFFWAGTAAGELRIQRCADCGALRHPPGPMCPRCGSPNPTYQVAAGTGEVYSYVVHHHPPVPGKQLPLVIALVRLDEGVRVLGELVGVRPDEVSVGMAVQADYIKIDDELTLPAWRPARPAGTRPAGLPELVIDVTPTFVVAAALATRDFTEVHHDRDRAVANGSKDIFLNILTDTGLVQRFVTDWAGPQATVREISIRLGVPCYAGDTLTFSGRVAEHTPGPDGDLFQVRVTGRCGLGDHVIATALVDVPAPGPAAPQSREAGLATKEGQA